MTITHQWIPSQFLKDCFQDRLDGVGKLSDEQISYCVDKLKGYLKEELK